MTALSLSAVNCVRTCNISGNSWSAARIALGWVIWLKNIILFVIGSAYARIVGSRGKGSISHSRQDFLRVLWAAPATISIYAENLLEFFREAGTAAEAIRLQPQNPQRELLRCLNDSTLGVIGLNVQLDHSWIDSDNFLDLAAAAEVPVIHWILDHASSRWRQFTKATAQNSRFIFLSPFSEQYFRRYALPGSLTACTVNTGPESSLAHSATHRDEFLARDIACLIPSQPTAHRRLV